MKKYVAILKDKNSDTIDPELIIRHVEHLKKTALNGQLFLCGPLLGHGGAMQIFVAESKDEAEKMLLSDPFLSEGFYTKYELYELLDANLENCFLLK